MNDDNIPVIVIIIFYYFKMIVVCCCKLNNAQICDEHLFGQVSNLAHVQVVTNCCYSIAQMCTCEDTLAHYLGAQFIDDP